MDRDLPRSAVPESWSTNFLWDKHYGGLRTYAVLMLEGEDPESDLLLQIRVAPVGNSWRLDFKHLSKWPVDLNAKHFREQFWREFLQLSQGDTSLWRFQFPSKKEAVEWISNRLELYGFVPGQIMDPTL